MWLPKQQAQPAGRLWLLLFSCGVANAGWYLDKSCYAHGDEIHKVMQSAFEIADIMQTSIGRVGQTQTGTDDQKRVQQAEFDLLKSVFAETVNDGKVDRNGQDFKDIETVLKDVLTFKDMKGMSASKNEDKINKLIADKTKKPFTPADNHGATELDSSAFANINDVFVYCDFERFTPAGLDCGAHESKDAKGNKMMCNKNSLSSFTPTQGFMECMNQNSKSKPFHAVCMRAVNFRVQADTHSS